MNRIRLRAMEHLIFSSIVLALTLFSGTANALRSHSDEPDHRAMLEAVLASTSTEWRAAFAERGSSYSPPQIVFLRPPVGHPARGAGYSRGVGLIIDLGDVESVLDASGDDGPSLAALMVAHEVGHHVQAILGDDPEVTGAARERQADCLAGWWIVRAKARADTEHRVTAWPVIDIRERLPQTLRVLDVLQSGQADGGAVNLDTHGTVEARVHAFEQGMAAQVPWTCLWGDNP